MANFARYLLLFFVPFLLVVEEVLPQTSSNRDRSTPKVVISNRDCGLKTNQLDNLVQNWESTTLVIIVSHARRDEKSKFGSRRLYNAKTYFTMEGLKNRRSTDLVLTAHGETAADDGYLDFYIQGELELRILFRKNDDLRLGDCAPDSADGTCPTTFDKMFYPCKRQ